MTDTKIIHGDCITEMKKLITENVKADLVLTDPPYGTTACKWDSIIPFNDMWDCIKKIRNDTTPILLFGSEPFSSNLRMSNIQEYKYDWIWNKQIGTNFFHRERQPLSDYENIIVFYKKTGQYYPIMEKSNKPIGNFKKNRNSSSNIMNFKPSEDISYKDNGLRYPKRIITCNSQKGECNNLNRVHPSQKPVVLLEYLIKTYTKEKDTVLDFTMGSGSTGIACQNTGRDFIGIELEEKYYTIAKDRLQENEVQKKLI